MFELSAATTPDFFSGKQLTQFVWRSFGAEFRQAQCYFLLLSFPPYCEWAVTVT